MHSTFSDGVEEPEELVIRAKNNGVELISLTDHDETGGLERMKAAAAQHGLQFVNGVEISADYGEVSIHVVGLDFDPEDEMLQALLGRIRANRFERAVQMAEKLERLGMKGVWEGVLEIDVRTLPRGSHKTVMSKITTPPSPSISPAVNPVM